MTRTDNSPLNSARHMSQKYDDKFQIIFNMGARQYCLADGIAWPTNSPISKKIYSFGSRSENHKGSGRQPIKTLIMQSFKKQSDAAGIEHGLIAATQRPAFIPFSAPR